MTYREVYLMCPRCRLSLERRTERDSWQCGTSRGLAVETSTLLRTFCHVAPELAVGGGEAVLTMNPRNGEMLPCAVCSRAMRPVEFALRGGELLR